MSLIKTSLFASALVSAALAFSACSETRAEYTVDRETVQGLPSVVATTYVRADVKVQAIDYATRSIALTGPNGVTQIFSVSPQAKRFKEIKTGDVIQVRYNKRISVSMVRVQEEPSAVLMHADVPTDESQKPGIFCTHNGRIVATVEAIDYNTRVVKLKPAGSDPITLTASPKLKDLDKVHVGDQVAINYLESISLNVD